MNVKRFSIIIIAASLLISCSRPQDDVAAHETHHHTPVALALNGEDRWQADEPTNKSMLQLQALMQEQTAVQASPSLEAYQQLGNSLEGELQQVFKNCTMQGEAHDMLHVYLVPLVEDVKVLKGHDLAASAAAHERLDERIQVYSTYFK